MNLFPSRIPFFPIWPAWVELDGIKVPLRKLPLDARTRRRLMRGSYEPAERDLVEAFIRPGDHILELGPSVGIVSCFLARRAGPQGRLVCVEADARLKRPFEEQMAANGVEAEWVNALCCPLWQETVPASAAMQAFQPGARSLSGRAVIRGAPDSSGPVWMTAQALCQRSQLAPSALVADIEGAEAIWAEHAPMLPHSVHTVIAEFHPKISGSRMAGQAIQAIVDEGFSIVGLRQSVVAFKRK